MSSTASPAGKRILRVTIESIDVAEDYVLEQGLRPIDDNTMSFECDTLEATFHQPYYQNTNWLSLCIDETLNSVTPFKYFVIWATQMLLNVIAVQQSEIVVEFLEKIFFHADKVKAKVISNTVAMKANDLNINESMSNKWLISYKTQGNFKPKGHPYPWSLS